MEKIFIPDDDRKGFVRGFVETDFEFADPLLYWKNRTIEKEKVLIKDLLIVADPTKVLDLPEEFFTKKATEKWDTIYDKVQKAGLHKNFIELLSADSKKKQVSLLKGMTLTPLQLMALFEEAGKKGFTLSTYHANQHHKGLDESALPNFLYVKDDEVKTSGKTSLTKGQLKQVITDRRVVVARFLDKCDEWHCFFTTYRALRGEETGGQPHFHYISDKWTIKREDAVKMFKGEKYPATSVHIGLAEYK